MKRIITKRYFHLFIAIVFLFILKSNIWSSEKNLGKNYLKTIKKIKLKYQKVTFRKMKHKAGGGYIFMTIKKNRLKKISINYTNTGKIFQYTTEYLGGMKNYNQSYNAIQKKYGKPLTKTKGMALWQNKKIRILFKATLINKLAQYMIQYTDLKIKQAYDGE